MNFSTKWNDKTAASWEMIRTKGKFRYVTLRWVVFWGLGSAALFNIMESFFRSHHGMPVNLTLGAFVMFPLAGIYMGMLHWNMLDAGCRNYRSQQEVKSLNMLSAKS